MYKVQTDKKEVTFIAIVFITFCFFSFIHYFFFLPIGWCKGYPFAFLMVPLVKNPLLLQFLFNYSNQASLMLLSIFFQIIIAFYYRRKKDRAIILIFLILIFSIISFYINKNKTTNSVSPSLLNDLCFIPWIDKNQPPYEQCLAFCKYAQKKSKSKRALYLAGESFFSFDIKNEPLFIAMIQELLLKNTDNYCILGGYSKIEEQLFNSFYCFNSSRIIKHYDKKMLLPYFEFLPTFFSYIRTFFSSLKTTIFFSGLNERDFIFLEQYPVLLPLICAEFFWIAPEEYQYYEDEFLFCALINDSFFKQDAFFLRQMRLLAQYISICLKRDSLYIGSYQGFLFTKNGTIFCLNDEKYDRSL